MVNFVDLHISVWSIIDQGMCSVKAMSRVIVWNNSVMCLVHRLSKVVSWIVSLPSWMVGSPEAVIVVHVGWIVGSMVHISLPDVVVLDELAVDRLEWHKVRAFMVSNLVVTNVVVTNVMVTNVMMSDLVVDDSW